mmetsp:Transcript_35944/g.40044  ORF Transcript_35944/g.40044 Transcript_35944/m.40044 type:complete len:395 (+) Transcript_35944:119-1303(+)
MRIFIRSLLAGGEIRRGYFVFPRAQKNKSRSGNHVDYGQCYNSYFHGHFSKRFFAFKNDTSIINNNNDDDINLVIRGHQIEFDVSRRIANLAESTIVGKNGETIALTTIATDTHPATDHNDSDIETTKGDHHSGYHKILGDSMKRICQHNNTSRMVPLTVEYRQRYHAVGKIPLSANRTDNRRQSDSEILASRAIDRSLRPLILLNDDEIMTLSSIHLTCSIQSYPIKEYNNGCGGGGGGHHHYRNQHHHNNTSGGMYANQNSAQSNDPAWQAYHAAQALANKQHEELLQQQAAASAAPASDAYYEQFHRYAYYYGEKAAREYYDSWSPPVGTINPYGSNPAGITAPPTSESGPSVTVAQAQSQSQAAVSANNIEVRDSSARKVSNLPAWMTKS